jgi:methyl-accepting chemotaxis protein
MENANKSRMSRTNGASHRGLKSKVLIVIVVVMLAGGVVLEFQNYRTLRNNMAAEARNSLGTFSSIFTNEVVKKSEDISLAVELMLENEQITTSFRQGDRSELEKLTADFFNERLKPAFGLSSFHFHVPPATSFLRVHKPEKFGDDLSSFRQMVVAVNTTKEPVIGLEVGRNGPQIRAVYPISHDSQHLGSVEFGGGTAGALSIARDITSTEYAVGIYEEVFQAALRFEHSEEDILKGDLTFYEYSTDFVKDIVAAIDMDQIGEMLTIGDRKVITGLFPITDYSGESVGQVFAIKDITEILRETTREIIKQSIIMSALMIALAVAMYLVVVGILNRSVLKPLRQTAEITNRIAQGDLAVDVPKVQSRDEIGTMNAGFREMLGSLNNLISQVNTAVAQVGMGSHQVAQASQSLSSGATEQASSLEEVSSSLTEINGQAQHNAESADKANAMARTTTDNAQTGNKQMQELISAMAKINDSSEEIKQVVKVIDDIAFQINLLALNANVEAARAGKYGKGFAVVADEVRNLAVRSAEAVKDTTRMVEESVQNTEEGAQAAGVAAQQLAEIVSGSTKVADLLSEIAVASKEQAQGVEQISSSLEQIDQVTQSNTASAEESASAAEELAAQAEHLRVLVARFKVSGSGHGEPAQITSANGNGEGTQAALTKI